jgi:chromosome partitioning protein
MNQLRLAILSNAGGSGKTTLATHLTYLLARSKHSVVTFDLDPQGSVTLFCGLERPQSHNTISAVLTEKGFDGNWSLVPLWKEKVKGAFACQGDIGLERTISELVMAERGAYLLDDRIQDYPLSHDVLIFDCPATLGPLPTIAISAATHILIPVQVEPKSTGGASKLLEWLYEKFRTLRLNPRPKILGFVPNQYDKSIAIHRSLLEQLVPMLSQLNIPYFDPIRFSSEFKNASAVGLPLHLYRPKHPACDDFNPIVKVLKAEIAKEKEL